MKIKTNLRRKLDRTTANKAAVRFRRPNFHLEQLEERTLLSGPGDIEWLRQFGSVTGRDDDTPSVAVDGAGNIYIAGYAYGTFPGQTSAGDVDAYLSKYDAAGNELWTRQFGSAAYDQAAALAVDASGVYVAGETLGALPGQTSAGGFDSFVRKYDTAGNELWTRQFGSAGREASRGATVDASGVYVVGDTTGTLPGQTSAGGNDAFVRKYDASGNLMWTRQFGSSPASSFDLASSVAVDAAGGVYVAGQVGGTLPGQTGVGPDAFFRKYDTSGNELWTRQFGAPPNAITGADSVSGVAVDSSGIYLAGTTSGIIPGQVSAGSDDAFVRKYDAAGNVLWTREFGSPRTDSASGIAVDASGIYVAGLTDGTLPGQTSAGDVDAFVRKYDAAGNMLWTHQLGTAGDEFGEGIGVDSSGVYVTGLTNGTFPGQVNAGGFDGFVRKYDTGGSELWTRQISSYLAQQDLARAVDADGNVYVAGTVTGVLLGQTSAGGTDAFVRKYDSAGNELWTRQFGTPATPSNTAPADIASSIAVDASGVYVAGTTNGLFPGQSSSGIPDAFVRKYDTNGNEVWTQQFGSDAADSATGIAVDGTGVYVAGTTSGFLAGFSGTQDAFVRKYSSSGGVLWTIQFGSSSAADQATGITADASGIYVSGHTGGALLGQTSAGGQDVFVRKLTSGGGEVWTRQFGTAGTDSATGVAADASGVYIAGFSSGAFAGQTNAGSDDAFVRKYDVDGTEVWTREFGTVASDQVNGATSGGSGVYLTGQTGAVLPGQTSAGGQDAFVGRLDAAGNMLWKRQFGTPATDSAVGVAVSASGLYVVGTTTGTFPGQSSGGIEDVFVARLVDSPNNTPPSVDAGPDATIDEGGTFSGFGSFTDPDADSWTATVNYGDGSGVQPLSLNPDKTFGLSHTYANDRQYFVTVTVTDEHGDVGSDTALVTVNNVLPVVNAGPDATINEGDTFDGSGYFTDPGADTWLATVDYGDGSGVQRLALSQDKTFNLSHVYTMNGVYTVEVSVEEAAPDTDPSDSLIVTVNKTVTNTAPSNVSLNLDSSVNENGTATLVGSFFDPDAGDTHTVLIDWGPGEGTTTLNLAAGTTTFSATHVYRDDNPTGTASDLYSISATVTEPAGNSASATASVTVNNVAPTNVVLSSGTIDENGTFTLTGSFVDPGIQDSHTLVINWGPGEGTTTLNLAAGVLSFSADHQYLDDNPSGTPSDVYPISVTVSDDDAGSGSASSTVTVNNVAPHLDLLSGPSAGVQVTGTSFSGVRGEELTFGSSFSDIGTLDAHHVSWNFGDGSSIGFHPSTDPGALATTHTYSAAGTYTISFIVRDDDGGEATVSSVVTILSWQLQADPCDPNLTALVVSGTTGNDTMIIHPGCGGTVQVDLNGTLLGSFKPTGRIVAYGLAGDDDIQVAGAISQQVWLYGDAGNDRLNAGNGGSLLIGGPGNDQLTGGGGRDVMIGGEGADKLVGNSGDDVLVAGFTTMDDREVAGHDAFWCAVLDEWISGNSFRTRIQNLTNGLGGNAHNRGSFLLPNVRDDLSPNAVDFLNGSAGDDWFIFIAGEDKVAGVAEATN